MHLTGSLRLLKSLLAVGCAFLASMNGTLLAEPALPPAASGEVLFDRDIRPIFERACFKCHGPEKQKSGYRLDLRDIALHAGDGYAPNIRPGASAESPLIKFVAGL